MHSRVERQELIRSKQRHMEGQNGGPQNQLARHSLHSWEDSDNQWYDIRSSAVNTVTYFLRGCIWDRLGGCENLCLARRQSLCA